MLSYTLSDGLGSVSEAVNPSGAVTASQLYAPYGNVRFQSGTLPTDRGFTGQRADAATSGLDYDNARYYDPVAGQFTSADTTLAGGFNRYGYVAGNPETWVDPSGHDLREGDEGTGAYLSGDGDDVGGGGGGGGGSGSGNGDPTTPLPTANGSELSYAYDDGTSATVYFDAPEGQIDGVDSPNGQLLESNAQIEAQAEANSADRLSQEDQPHGDDGQQNSTPSASKIRVISATTHDTETAPIPQEVDNGNVVEVVLDGVRYPETAQHIENAIDNGQPEELTIDREGAKANRQASLKGYATQPGADRDEYPLAMTVEGGVGADIQYIDPSDNRGAGSSIGNQLKGLPDGTRFRINILWGNE